MATDRHAGNSNYELEATLSLVDQDYADNTSRVRLIVEDTKLTGSGFSGYGNMSGSAVVNGTTVWSVSGDDWSFVGGSPMTVRYLNIVRTIAHDDEGEKTVSFSATTTLGSSVGKASVSGSLKLPKIPRGPRVRVSGSWKNTMAYVRVSGSWKLAIPYIRSGGVWKIAGG